jgi:hypothetical protein
MGAGLHVAAYYLEHETELGATATVISVVVPVTIYTLALYGIYSVFMRESDPFHLWLLAGTAAVLVLTVVLAAAGVGMPVCLLVLVLAPVVTVVGYETLGYRHVEEALATALLRRQLGAGAGVARTSWTARNGTSAPLSSSQNFSRETLGNLRGGDRGRPNFLDLLARLTGTRCRTAGMSGKHTEFG